MEITYKTMGQLIEEFNIIDDGGHLTLEIKHPDLNVRINDDIYKKCEQVFNPYTIIIKNKREEKIGELTFYKSIKLSDYNIIRPSFYGHNYRCSDILNGNNHAVASFAPISGIVESIIDADINIENIILLYKVELHEEYRNKKLLPYIMNTVFDNFITNKSLVILEAISLSERRRKPEYQQKQTEKLIKYYNSIFNNVTRVDDTNFMYMIKY